MPWANTRPRTRNVSYSPVSSGNEDPGAPGACVNVSAGRRRQGRPPFVAGTSTSPLDGCQLAFSTELKHAVTHARHEARHTHLMPPAYLPTLYKARKVPTKQAMCAICAERTRGKTRLLELGHG